MSNQSRAGQVLSWKRARSALMCWLPTGLMLNYSTWAGLVSRAELMLSWTRASLALMFCSPVRLLLFWLSVCCWAGLALSL
jgi:hypothetical protein